jgi:hypothetical protein
MLETGREVCLRCGAWYDDFSRGLAGQPFRLMVLRRLAVLLWIIWVLAAVASLSQNYLLALVAGLVFIPLGVALFTLSVRAYQKQGVLVALASTYLWVLLLIVEAGLDGTSGEGVGAMVMSSMGVLVLGWPTWRLYVHPVIAPNPWCCYRCGYMLIGLTGNRCPECGERFNPVQVAKSIPPHRRRQFALDETGTDG